MPPQQEADAPLRVVGAPDLAWGVLALPTIARRQVVGGKAIHFRKQSQSALTSTRQDLGRDGPFRLLASDLSHCDPSCLQVGHSPVARTIKDHFTTAFMSCHVLGPTCL